MKWDAADWFIAGLVILFFAVVYWFEDVYKWL